MAVSCGHRDKLPGCGDRIQARLQSYSSGGGGSKVSLIGKQQGISRLPPPLEGSLLLDVLGKENLLPAFSIQRPHIPMSVVPLSSSQHLTFPSASILWSPSLTLQPSYSTSAVPSSPQIMQDSPHLPHPRSLPSSHLQKWRVHHRQGHCLSSGDQDETCWTMTIRLL